MVKEDLQAGKFCDRGLLVAGHSGSRSIRRTGRLATRGAFHKRFVPFRQDQLGYGHTGLAGWDALRIEGPACRRTTAWTRACPTTSPPASAPTPVVLRFV